MANINAWMDRRFIDNWRTEIRRLWSVRAAAVWVVVGVAFALLALVSDELKSVIGWKAFSAVFVVTGVSFGLARVLKQPGTDE